MTETSCFVRQHFLEDDMYIYKQWYEIVSEVSLRIVHNCYASTEIMIQGISDWWLSIKYLHIC